MLFRLRRIRPTLADRNAPRLPAHATRVVRCYRCGSVFETSAFAESTSCTRCGGAVRIPDVIVDRGHWGGSIQTAGRVHVLPGCTVRASLIVASGDVLIEGTVHAMIVTGGQVRVTGAGQLKGGARCKTLIVEPGAVVFGGPFESHSQALGTIDIETASRSTPGKGPAARVPALDVALNAASGDLPHAREPRTEIEPKPSGRTEAYAPPHANPHDRTDPVIVRLPRDRRQGDLPRLRVVP